MNTPHSDRYVKGYNEARARIACKTNTPEAMRRVAEGDMEPDDFTAGWIAACEEALNPPTGTLEQIIRDIVRHDREHPDHGIGCACHDPHAGALRQLFEREGLYDIKKFTEDDGTPRTYHASTKSLRNLVNVFVYVIR